MMMMIWQEAFTAGDFVRSSRQAIDDILTRGGVPIVVGGTSMYNQWLVRGKPDAPRLEGVGTGFFSLMLVVRQTNLIDGGRWWP